MVSYTMHSHALASDYYLDLLNGVEDICASCICPPQYGEELQTLLRRWTRSKELGFQIVFSELQ